MDAAGSLTQAAELAPAQSRERGFLQRAGTRLSYWAPVWLLMILFAQIAFLGLRPALAESRRMQTAQAALEARLATALELQGAVDLQLRARQDPIFRERQRRMRFHPPETR